MLSRFTLLLTLLAGLFPAIVHQAAQVTQFDNLLLDESLILYINGERNLTLEHIDSGTMVGLTNGGNVAGFDISPTRQTVYYDDQSDTAHLISLEFTADGPLIVTPPVGPFPAANQFVDWSPDGAKLAYVSRDSQPVAITTRGEPLPLAPGIVAFGGWSHDSHWLAYCRTGGELGIVDPTGASRVVAEGLDCPSSLGDIMSWSPTAPMLAFGVGDSSEGFMTTYVYDVVAGTTYPLPQTGELLGWSPGGRTLAIGHGRVGAALHIPSITITDLTGQRSVTVPSIITAQAGVIGWLNRPTPYPIFGNHYVADDLSFTENIGDAVFDASADGGVPLWGSIVGSSMAIMCEDPRFADEVIFYAPHPVLPDPNSPNSATVRPFPGVEAMISPDGRTALVRAYVGAADGQGQWELYLLSCPDGVPLLKQMEEERSLSSDGVYSADSRFLLLMSPMSGGGSAPQIIEIAGNVAQVRRTYAGYPSDFEWLITPYAGPPVSQPAGPDTQQAVAAISAPPAPQANTFAFVEEGDIWLINVDGSGRQQITHSGNDCCLAWSPDGGRLYFVRNPRTKFSPPDTIGVIMVYDFATGQERAIDTAGVSVADSLAVSPDGRRLLFSDRERTEMAPFGEVAKGCLNLFDLDTGEQTVIDCEAPGSFRGIAFSPVAPAFAAEIGFYESSTLSIYASPSSPRQTDYRVCCFEPSFTADGVGMYTLGNTPYGDVEHQINYYERYDSAPTILLRSDQVISGLDVAPEGDRLLYVHGETIEIMSLPSRMRTPIVTGREPAWRPVPAPVAGEDDPGQTPIGSPSLTTDTSETDTDGDGILTPVSGSSRPRQSSGGTAGVLMMFMVVGLLIWGVFIMQRK